MLGSDFLEPTEVEPAQTAIRGEPAGTVFAGSASASVVDAAIARVAGSAVSAAPVA